MFSACFAVILCPSCDEALPVADIVFPDEPMLVPVTCSSCGKEWQVRKDDVDGMVVEERREN